MKANTNSREAGAETEFVFIPQVHIEWLWLLLRAMGSKQLPGYTTSLHP